MSEQITDTAGNAITYLSLTLDEITESAVFTIRVPCQAGMVLASTVDAYASVMARRAGVGAFQNIATSPIDLSPWAGGSQNFEVKVVASEVTGLQRTALPVRVRLA